MKERYLSKTPNVTFVYLSKCNIKLPGFFGNSKKRFLRTGLVFSLNKLSFVLWIVFLWTFYASYVSWPHVFWKTWSDFSSWCWAGQWQWPPQISDSSDLCSGAACAAGGASSHNWKTRSTLNTQQFILSEWQADKQDSSKFCFYSHCILIFVHMEIIFQVSFFGVFIDSWIEGSERWFSR